MAPEGQALRYTRIQSKSLDGHFGAAHFSATSSNRVELMFGFRYFSASGKLFHFSYSFSQGVDSAGFLLSWARKRLFLLVARQVVRFYKPAFGVTKEWRPDRCTAHRRCPAARSLLVSPASGFRHQCPRPLLPTVSTQSRNVLFPAK